MLIGILAVILILIAIVLLWVLFAPFSIKADTYSNEYCLNWGGLGKAELIPLADDILIRLHVAFWSKDFYPLHPSPSREKKKPEKPARKKKRKTGRPFPFRRIIGTLKTFKVKDFQLEVDTGDYIWNAYLYPILYWLKPLRNRVTVNFQGRNECRLLIRNQAWRMAWGWWKG